MGIKQQDLDALNGILKDAKPGRSPKTTGGGNHNTIQIHVDSNGIAMPMWAMVALTVATLALVAFR